MIWAYDALHWITFFSVAVLLVLAPGPDHIYVLSNALKKGRAAGFAAWGGILTGMLTHTGLVALGLAALLAASESALDILKICGGVYLMYLGYGALRSHGIDLGSAAPQKSDLRKIYFQGLGINILNPKIFIFFLAFLPQFVEPQAGPAWAQLVLHALLLITMGSSFQWMLIETAARLTVFLQNRPKVPVMIDRLFGVIMIVMGLRLALGA